LSQIAFAQVDLYCVIEKRGGGNAEAGFERIYEWAQLEHWVRQPEAFL
jgi:hypothetical protein